MLNKKDLSNIQGVFLLGAVSQFSGKRKAAETLGMSIETMNKYIENLEADIGVKLLYSNDKGSKLTEDGEKVVRQVPVLQEVLHNIYGMSTRNAVIRGKVRVAMNVNLRFYLDFEQYEKFLKDFSDLSVVSILTLDDPDIRNHAFDVALCSKIPNNSDIVEIMNKKVECGFLASVGYLSKHGKPNNLQDLLENHRILLKHATFSYDEPWKEIYKSAKNVVYCSNCMVDLLDAVRNDVGICLLPTSLAQNGLVWLEGIKCGMALNFHLLAYRETKNFPKNRVVIEAYKKLLESI